MPGVPLQRKTFWCPAPLPAAPQVLARGNGRRETEHALAGCWSVHFTPSFTTEVLWIQEHLMTSLLVFNQKWHQHTGIMLPLQAPPPVSPGSCQLWSGRPQLTWAAWIAQSKVCIPTEFNRTYTPVNVHPKFLIDRGSSYSPNHNVQLPQ